MPQITNKRGNDLVVYGDNSGNKTYRKTVTLKQEVWKTPTLLNSWVNSGGIYNDVGYFKDSVGVVHIKGHVKNGTIGQPIFTLPVGYRPSKSVISANISYNGSTSVISRIEVKNDGNVYASVGGNVEFPIDGITFLAEA